MRHFKIYNKTSGQDMGEYFSESKSAALQMMAEEVGQTLDDPNDWVVEELFTLLVGFDGETQ